jgi:predicted CoA-binding protein
MKIKMFDNEVIPKYIVGKGYRIISVNPATTDAIFNKCTLQTNIIS